jgi:HemY protein
MPDLPSRYVPSMPFIKAAQKRAAALPQPDDPGIFDDAVTGQDLDEVEVRVKPERRARAAPKAK